MNELATSHIGEKRNLHSKNYKFGAKNTVHYGHLLAETVETFQPLLHLLLGCHLAGCSSATQRQRDRIDKSCLMQNRTGLAG